MRGTEALEADEDVAFEESCGILSANRGAPGPAMNNGTNGKNGGNSDVKYPPNCALRLGSTPGSGDGDDTDPYEPKQNTKIFRILTVLIYVFTVSFGAILLSLYYLFLWDPYHPDPTPTPYAQTNSPATPSPSTTSLATPSIINADRQSTLSDSTLDNLVEDLNNGVEPKALALAIKALSQSEKGINTNPYIMLFRGNPSNLQ